MQLQEPIAHSGGGKRGEGGGDLDDQGIAGKQGGGEGVEDVVEGVIPGNDCTNLQHGKE